MLKIDFLILFNSFLEVNVILLFIVNIRFLVLIYYNIRYKENKEINEGTYVYLYMSVNK